MNDIKATIIDECFKPIQDIGSNTYQNICTGELIEVPWGSMDWALLVLLISAIVGGVYFFRTIIKLSTY